MLACLLACLLACQVMHAETLNSYICFGVDLAATDDFYFFAAPSTGHVLYTAAAGEEGPAWLVVAARQRATTVRCAMPLLHR